MFFFGSRVGHLFWMDIAGALVRASATKVVDCEIGNACQEGTLARLEMPSRPHAGAREWTVHDAPALGECAAAYYERE